MAEGSVYQCEWEEAADGYTVWWKFRPHVRATAATFEAACDEVRD